MFSFKKNINKYFSEKASNQTKKFRREMENYKLKDFTKNYYANEWIKKKIEERDVNVLVSLFFFKATSAGGALSRKII